MPRDRLLMLSGSPTDRFHERLSLAYAVSALRALRAAGMTVDTVHVTPDADWRFAETLDGDILAATARQDREEALAEITRRSYAALIPQMFCPAGMTTFRRLFEDLGMPIIGNSSDAMALTLQKGKTRDMVSAAGVPVPRGHIAHGAEGGAFTLPCVVKPTSGDNSFGVSFVERESDYETAVSTALSFGPEVLVEEFVPLGREVRCGVIETDSGLRALPMLEYHLEPSRPPIRGVESKLSIGPGDDVELASKTKPTSTVVPADDPINDRVAPVALAAHRALGCRHYSLFDFRIDPAGQPRFLEAGLYCSFAPESILVMMAKAAGIGIGELLSSFVDGTTRNAGADLELASVPINL